MNNNDDHDPTHNERIERELARPFGPKALLDAWVVPAVPSDLPERVMTRLDESWSDAQGRPARQNAVGGRLATLTATVAFLASAAAVLLALRPRDGQDATPAVSEQGDPSAITAKETQSSAGPSTGAQVRPVAAVAAEGVSSSPGPSTGALPRPAGVATEAQPSSRAAIATFADEPPLAESPTAAEKQPKLKPPATSTTSNAPKAERQPRATQADPRSVRGGAPQTDGPLDAGVLRRVVRNHLNEVRHCYHQALAHDPTLVGRVTVQFTIEPSGDVSQAAVFHTTMHDTKIPQCVVTAVRRWRFPRFDGGASTKVTYPFEFSAEPKLPSAAAGPGQPGPRSVRSGAVKTAGDLTAEVLRRVVRHHLREVQHCYGEGLARDRTLAGRVTVAFTIDPSGKVSQATIGDGNFPDATVAQCIVGAVRRWQFPRSVGGGATAVIYPFELSPD